MFVFSRLLKELRLDCWVKNGAKISPSFFFSPQHNFLPGKLVCFFFFFSLSTPAKQHLPWSYTISIHALFFFSLWFFLPVLHSCLTAPVLLLLSLHTVVFIPETSPQSWSVVVSRGQGLSSHSCCFLSVKERVFFFFFGKSTNLQNIKKKSLSWPSLCLSAVDTCPEVII